MPPNAFRRPSLVATFLAVCLTGGTKAETISRHVTLQPGPINGVIIDQNGGHLAVYGDPRKEFTPVELVLFTHHRRDVVWAGEAQVRAGAKAVVPERERAYFEEPGRQWESFIKIRLRDAAQQSTKMPVRPLPVARGVKGGDVIEWRGLRFQALETPGFTRDAVSYLAEIDGSRIAFTGDLIYGDGQIFDLYSFQDAIPEAKIGGYHGYGARLAQLLKSLESLATAKPDLIIPARGPVIKDVPGAIARLISRVRKLYHNYLSTNALYWYFKEDRMKACAERVLGVGAPYQLMPYSHYEDLPDWVLATGTTRILLAENGAAFLLDCGSQRYIDFVKDLMKQGLIKKVEGLFVTHYHGDHTDFVQAAAEEFNCPVYATEEYADILERPGAWHMPAGTHKPIAKVIAQKDGTKLKWHEYTLTFRFYPGQTLLHGALLAQRPGGPTIFFVGDSFTPSGMDDYCVLNRNLLHDDTGYLLCFRVLRELKRQIGDFYLMNEHVPHIFRYTDEQMDYLEGRYRERIAMLRELVPWDDPNYGVDEQWAWFYPYGADTEAGQRLKFEFRFWNHSPKARDMQIRPNLPDGFSLLGGRLKMRVGAGKQATLDLEVQVSAGVKPGHHILTADVLAGDIELREWAEAIVTVKE